MTHAPSLNVPGRSTCVLPASRAPFCSGQSQNSSCSMTFVSVPLSLAPVAIDDIEDSGRSSTKYEGGNKVTVGVKGGYFPVPPVDSSQDIRSTMCLVMEEMGSS